MSIQAYDIQLGPAGSNNSTQIIEATAQICDFLSSGSAFDQIEVRPNFMQGVATLKLGQGFDFGQPVDRWLVVNKGATPVNGTVMLSTAGFRNFRISGDVNVLDGGKSRTLSGAAFAGYGSIGAVAGQYCRVQLWNPATNPNRLVVENVTVLANGSMLAAVIQFNGSQLATAIGAGISKKSGGANSAATINTDTTATQLVLPALIGMAEQNPGTQGFKFAEPVVVTPGNGLLVYSSTLNTTMGASFEWYEEPNT
jgi:hypothetical protein